jgi:hypothetical protein
MPVEHLVIGLVVIGEEKKSLVNGEEEEKRWRSHWSLVNGEEEEKRWLVDGLMGQEGHGQLARVWITNGRAARSPLASARARRFPKALGGA